VWSALRKCNEITEGRRKKVAPRLLTYFSAEAMEEGMGMKSGCSSSKIPNP